MKETLYITSKDFSLSKKGDAILFITKDPDLPDTERKKTIPTSMLSSIEIYGNNTVTTPFLKLCNDVGIPIYFNTYNGIPFGTFTPENSLSSIVKAAQYASINKMEQKIHISKEIVKKSACERIKIIKKFGKKNDEINDIVSSLMEKCERAEQSTTIDELRGCEGNMMKTYLDMFSRMLYHIPFSKRTRKPPEDEGNSILSWGNTLLYNTVRNEVYRSGLDPKAGFLHEIHENRQSLAIDISEIFRPIIVDNLILKLDHKKNLRRCHFDKDEFKCFLNQQGKRIWIREYDEFLHSTIHYSPLNRNISVKEEIRLECYNLIKYITGERNDYKPIDFKNE